MAGTLVTARHGRPDINRDIWITSKEYGPWWGQYDASGLDPDLPCPDSLKQHATEADFIFSSTLPRSIETAEWAIGRNADGELLKEFTQDAIFVEAALPPPPLPFVKLRPGQWGVVSRSYWFWGYTPKGVEGHMACWRRVKELTDQLLTKTEEGNVLLCAHGYLNWMIDREMRNRLEWRRQTRDNGNEYFSWRQYEKYR